MATLTIVAPMPENVTNRDSGRSHWRTRHSEKVAYWNRLDQRQAAGLIPPPPLEPFARSSIRSAMVLRGGMDDDNAMARHKLLLDWLVSRGYLAGDRKKHLRWEAMPDQRVTRKEPATITLTLTPL